MNLHQCSSRPIQHNQDLSTWPSIEELHLEQTNNCAGEYESEAKFKGEWGNDSVLFTGDLEQRT
ncbi:hypothetical protein RISK_002434 [Rhodopirellula islandica]|uniref:Uncharacterized protein n=1 Tax=Rhodopirellula islandica TaxID=595434 RepID=A0A0J1BGX2_RHOIS|nr:hypothetical protein RISK_002434 [Rhodopirellula islandica]